jgi:hypothetical protein
MDDRMVNRRGVLRTGAVASGLVLAGCSSLLESDSTAGEESSTTSQRQREAGYRLSERITSPDPQPYENFGAALAVHGDRMLVGAPNEYAVDPETGEPKQAGAGHAYVFEREDGGWTQTGELRPTTANGGSGFGSRVALSEEYAFVAAPAENTRHGTRSGAVYSFSKVNQEWLGGGRFTEKGGQPNRRFGTAIAASGETLLVGSPAAPTSQERTGAVYHFEKQQGAWTQSHTVTPSDPQPGDRFGAEIVRSDETVVVGAPGTFQHDPGVGTAYTFTQDDDVWTQAQRLVAGDGDAHDTFGQHLAIVGTNTAASRLREHVGSCHVYELSSDGWWHAQQLTQPDGAHGTGFGQAVALAGSTTIVGAPHVDREGQTDAGEVYVYAHS